MPFLRRYLPGVTLAIVVAAFYLYKLSGVGVLSADEPRYAAIGLDMAHTGDWITPRLWGAAWFEKPPLLYWMTALGSACGLRLELAGRVPVALLSLVFLIAFYFLLKRQFGPTAAAISALLLSTSAGWIVYSSLCLTDIPLAVCFSMAMLLCMPLLRTESLAGFWRLAAVGACLGSATLAKGLVPLALMAPWLWYLRHHWRRWWITAASLLLVALPWYLAVYQRNGYPFIEEFFVRHHFERLYSASLQHVQPFYFYLPVLLAGLFPWTPMLWLVAKQRQRWDVQRSFLLVTASWGLLFFSMSLNKLPGYLLPILPALFASVGAYYQQQRLARTSRWLWLTCALLVATIPLLVAILPESLARGKFTWSLLNSVSRTTAFYVLSPLAVVWLARRSWIGPLLAMSVIAGGLYLKALDFPVMDQNVSARGLWRELQKRSEDVCDAGANRDWLYGLNFYRGTAIPFCQPVDSRIKLRSEGRQKKPSFVQ